MAVLAMTADQVAEELEYRRTDGTGNGDLIRELYRNGDFPAPIDPDQPAIRWRWSRVRVEQYVAGEWRDRPRPAVLFGSVGEQHVDDRGVA